MRLLVVLLPLLAACFDPELRDGAVSCGSGNSCPPGFDCNPADKLCYRDLPGASIDAAVDGDVNGAADADTDAPPMPDAAMIDASTNPACSDGVDNDCDGGIDFGNDPGCSSASDNDEHGSAKCDNGMDDDQDGFTDFHPLGASCGVGDPGCTGPNDNSEN